MDGRVKVIEGKKPLMRKTLCYKLALFIVAVLLATLIITCVIVVVLRGELMKSERVNVRVINLELEVKRHYYDTFNSFYDKMDTHGNGSVVVASQLAYFDVLDVDENGVVSTDELVMTIGPEYSIVLEAEDFNNDGVIRRTEIPEIHARVDIDDDGKMTKNEFIFYHELARRAIHERAAL